MLEIIILIFLTKKIGEIAVSKGLPAGRWKLYTVLAWVASEFIGAIIGVMIFGADNLFSCFLLAIAGAIGSYFIIKGYLSKQPDVFDENDINHIGS
jgi:hypothetical protein